MPLTVKINVALWEQNCQNIGSERVKFTLTMDISELQKLKVGKEDVFEVLFR